MIFGFALNVYILCQQAYSDFMTLLLNLGILFLFFASDDTSFPVKCIWELSMKMQIKLDFSFL